MKTALIVASVLTVAGIIIAAVGLAIMGFDFTKLSTAKTVTRTFEIDEGFDSITVGTSTCDVRLLPSEDGKCKIVCTDRDKITYDVGVENNTLAIEEKDGRKWYDYISIFNYKTEITLYLPETCLKSLSATGDTGNVTVPKDFSFENIDVKVSTGKISIMSATSGSLSLKTSTGNISVSDSSPEEITVKASTGSITVKNCNSQSFDAECSTGNISLNSVNVSGAVRLKTSTGSIRYTDSECQSLRSESSTGDITIESTKASGEIDMNSDTGNVKLIGCDGATVSIETDTGDVYCSFLSDKIVFAQSDTGKIRVPKTTSGGRCDITSDTGNIEVVIK